MKSLRKLKQSKKSSKIIVLFVVFMLVLIIFGTGLLSIVGQTTTTYLNNINELTEEEVILLAPMLDTENDWNILPNPETSPLYLNINDYVFGDEADNFVATYMDLGGDYHQVNIEARTVISDVTDLIRTYTCDITTGCAGYVAGLSPYAVAELEEGDGFCSLLSMGYAEHFIASNDDGWIQYFLDSQATGNCGEYNDPGNDIFCAIGKAYPYYTNWDTFAFVNAPGSGGSGYDVTVNTWVNDETELWKSIHIPYGDFPGEGISKIYFRDFPLCSLDDGEIPTYIAQCFQCINYNEGFSNSELYNMIKNYPDNGDTLTHMVDNEPLGWSVHQVDGWDFIIATESSSGQDSICTPYMEICDGDDLHRCTADGETIEYKECDSCTGGTCSEGWVDPTAADIESGFFVYEAISNNQIKKTAHILTVGTIPILHYGESFTIEVAVGDMVDVFLEAKFYDDDGILVDTFQDSVPDITISSNPLSGDGTVVLTVSKDGQTQTTVKNIYVIEPVMTVTYPQNSYKGQNIHLDVEITDFGETCIVDAAYYRGSDNGLVDTSYGDNVLGIDVTYPLMEDGYMIVTAHTTAGDITKQYPLDTITLALSVVQPDMYITDETFDLEVSFNVPSLEVDIDVRIYDGPNDITYEGMMPTITIDDPPFEGNTIIEIEAPYGGETYTKTFNVDFTTLVVMIEGGTFEYGLTTTIDTYLHQNPSDILPVNVEIIKDGTILETYSGYTPSVVLSNPKAYKQCQIKSTVNNQYIGIRNVNFGGNPVVTEATTESGIQYEMNPIVYTITVRDSLGEYLTPTYISNIVPYATLSMGTVDSMSYTHKGDGEYEIYALVTGVGNFAGRLNFDFLNEPITSNAASIIVEENSVDISVLGIPNSAIRGEYFTGTVRVFNPMGESLDPDNLYINIDLPDGTESIITFSELYRVSTGIYEFNYRPAQLELYTFEAIAEKDGMTSGSAVRQVAVNDEYTGEDLDAAGNILGLIMENIIIVIISFIGIIIILWKFMKK